MVQKSFELYAVGQMETRNSMWGNSQEVRLPPGYKCGN